MYHQKKGGGGCYLHVVPLVTSFRRLNTPSTCLPWVASRIGGRRDPGGWGRRRLRTPYSQHTTLALISLSRAVWWARPDQSAFVSWLDVHNCLISSNIILTSHHQLLFDACLQFHSHLQLHDHGHHVIVAYGLIWWRNLYIAYQPWIATIHPRLPRTLKKDEKTQKNQILTMSLELDTIK